MELHRRDMSPMEIGWGIATFIAGSFAGWFGHTFMRDPISEFSRLRQAGYEAGSNTQIRARFRLVTAKIMRRDKDVANVSQPVGRNCWNYPKSSELSRPHGCCCPTRSAGLVST